MDDDTPPPLLNENGEIVHRIESYEDDGQSVALQTVSYRLSGSCSREWMRRRNGWLTPVFFPIPIARRQPDLHHQGGSIVRSTGTERTGIFCPFMQVVYSSRA